MSPSLTSEPGTIIPLSSKFLSASKPAFGTSRVISSRPDPVFNSLVSISYSSI
jgi:hypothetical protein